MNSCSVPSVLEHLPGCLLRKPQALTSQSYYDIINLSVITPGEVAGHTDREHRLRIKLPGLNPGSI